MEGKGKQAFFILDPRFPVSDIEEDFHLISFPTGRKEKNLSILLHNNEALGFIRRFFHPERAIEF